MLGHYDPASNKAAALLVCTCLLSVLALIKPHEQCLQTPRLNRQPKKSQSRAIPSALSHLRLFDLKKFTLF